MTFKSIPKIYDAGLLLWILFFGLAGCDRQSATTGDPVANLTEPLAATSLPRQLPIKVLLFKGQDAWFSCPDADYTLLSLNTRRELIRLRKNHRCRLIRVNDRWQLLDDKGNTIWTQDTSASAPLEFRPRTAATLATGRNLMNHYRGRLQCYSLGPDNFAVVNLVDIEDYLAGVLGAEMPAHWHSAALRAQCIAARTYAIYNMHCQQGKYLWDIGSTQASQVYGGVGRETPRLRQLVNQTRGLVLTCGPQGREKMFPTYYSAVCGGHTQNAAPVFGHDLAPLGGNNCPYCQTTAPPDRYRWQTVNIQKEQVNKLLLQRFPKLKALQRIVDINIVQRSNYGRIEKVELVGSNGNVSRIRGEDLRLAVTTQEKPILSSWFDLQNAGPYWQFQNGHGWGHGVGLCQYGCQQMARLGHDTIDILQHYYPDSVLLRAY